MIVSLMHFINVFHRQVRKTYNDIWIQKTYKLLPIELVPSRNTNRCSFVGGFLDRYQIDTCPDFTWNDNHISNRRLPNRRAGRISERLLRKGNWYLPHRVLCVCVWLHAIVHCAKRLEEESEQQKKKGNKVIVSLWIVIGQNDLFNLDFWIQKNVKMVMLWQRELDEWPLASSARGYEFSQHRMSATFMSQQTDFTVDRLF